MGNTFRLFWIIFIKSTSSIINKYSKCRFQSCDFVLFFRFLLTDNVESTLAVLQFTSFVSESSAYNHTSGNKSLSSWKYLYFLQFANFQLQNRLKDYWVHSTAVKKKNTYFLSCQSLFIQNIDQIWETANKLQENAFYFVGAIAVNWVSFIFFDFISFANENECGRGWNYYGLH